MENLHIYNSVREVPKEAQKAITGGRLSGKTDINPMWRIKRLTEIFGAIGVGWKYTITKQWLEEGGQGEKAAFVNIDLFYKNDGEWSEAIPGTGGSMFVSKERSGLYTSDECFKMALTDAISVACKALGVGADIYWDKDPTKYTNHPEVTDQEPVPQTTDQKPILQVEYECEICSKKMPKKWALQAMEKYGKVVCSAECLQAMTTHTSFAIKRSPVAKSD